MKKSALLKFSIFAVIAFTVFDAEISFAQTDAPAPKNLNFGYSQNPRTKKKVENSESKTENENKTENKPEVSPVQETENNSVDSENSTNQNANYETRSAANKTLEVVKRANTAAVAPTEIYKIGVGDVLFISLQNAPAKDSTYFTVLNDGTIDYPLAGEMVSVSGLTTEEIEDLLKSKIKLYENPQVSVKVREHASHSITVLGMVEKAGEKYLQREAMPLFVVRAEAIVQSKANLAVIKRTNSTTETINLNDSKSDDVLIFPGDIIEFKSSDVAPTDSSALQFYYIGGNVASAGQKDFHAGLTLTQAILASGGLRRQSVKKVVVRRKNQDGLLSPLEFNLDAIKDGKQPDPAIQAGDTIEIVN
ncbi:MAG: polysaccharide biosynthesis/export family protein [Pyrinomonadaceae bacterium]